MKTDFTMITGRNLWEIEGRLNTYIVVLGSEGHILTKTELNKGIIAISERHKLSIPEMLHLAISAANTCSICRTKSYINMSNYN